LTFDELSDDTQMTRLMFRFWTNCIMVSRLLLYETFHDSGYCFCFSLVHSYTRRYCGLCRGA
jgi:hypothetical protein